MFGILKKMFVVLLNSLVNASCIVNAPSHAKSVSLSNQKCEIQPTLIILHLNEYSQEFHHYPFAIKLDLFVGICNTFNDLSNKVCV